MSYIWSGLTSQNRSGVSSFYLCDSQGSVRNLVNAAGAITDTYLTTAFGVELLAGSGTVNPFRYVGLFGYYLEFVNLYYVRARWLDALKGRWDSRDRIRYGGGDINLYRYVANEVTGSIDPYGLAGGAWGIILANCGIGFILGGISGLIHAKGSLKKRFSDSAFLNAMCKAGVNCAVGIILAILEFNIPLLRSVDEWVGCAAGFVGSTLGSYICHRVSVSAPDSSDRVICTFFTGALSCLSGIGGGYLSKEQEIMKEAGKAAEVGHPLMGVACGQFGSSAFGFLASLGCVD